MSDDTNDFFVDDIDQPKKKKKINCGRKGKSVERALCKILNTRFTTGFSRTVGSGARISQTQHLTKAAKDVFTGDIVTPENFKFCLESKGGYDDVDWHLCFEDGHGQIDYFLNQAKTQSDGCARKPMVCWKRNHRPWLAILLTKDLPSQVVWSYRFIYREWSCVLLNNLLSVEDSYWLEK